MLSDFVCKTNSAWLRRTAAPHYCPIAFVGAAASSETCSPDKTEKMGNTNAACQMSNYSKRNIRVFVREKPLQIDDFITSQSEGDDKSWKSLTVLPGDKKFTFRKDSKCIRVLACQTQEIPWEADLFLSVFVEDEDDENICSKQIMHNMALSAPVTVLLYDV